MTVPPLWPAVLPGLSHATVWLASRVDQFGDAAVFTAEIVFQRHMNPSGWSPEIPVYAHPRR